MGPPRTEATPPLAIGPRMRVPVGANARPGRIGAPSALGLTCPRERPLVIGCGALAKELVALTRRAGLPEVDLTCLSATLHNRPERIPGAVRDRIRRARAAGRMQLFVAYADCGTGGLLDRVLEDEGVARLEGAHCYEVYAGRAAFAHLAEEEPGTFYLTDFLARNFERLVIRGLGLDRHPDLLPLYFGNYRRVVYLAQTEDPVLTVAARRAARRLGLHFERRFTGYGELAPAVSASRRVTESRRVAAHADDRESRFPAPDERWVGRGQGSQTDSQRSRIRAASSALRGHRPPAPEPVAQESWTSGPERRATGARRSLAATQAGPAT